MKVDIAVVGGGSAGIAASVAAARKGASVVLIERLGLLGGMGSAANVHTICGLYRLRKDAGEPLVPVNEGIPMEFADILLRSGGANGPVRMGKLDVLVHTPALFAEVAAKITGQQSNLDVLLNTEVTGVQRNEDEITHIRLNCGDRVLQVLPTMVIDTTGDAELAFLAGAETRRESLEKLQRPAYVFGLGGLAPEALADSGKIAVARAISYGVRDGKLPLGSLGAAFRAGVHRGEGWGTIDLIAEGFDPANSECRALIQAEGRKLSETLTDYLRNELEEFSCARITSFPVHAGIRESRRVKGLYELTQDDIISGARFADEVAFSSWPIELRETSRGPKFRFPEGNRSCGIPLRSMRSADTTNLFMAGRCISSSHEAQAAIRVMGTCMATGEAAARNAVSLLSATKETWLKTTTTSSSVINS
jgi:hypothetical protein